MLSSNHHLSLYTKLVTVLNKEDWQSMKKTVSYDSQHHFITQYISLRCTAVDEFYRMIRMGVAVTLEVTEQRPMNNEYANA